MPPSSGWLCHSLGQGSQPLWTLSLFLLGFYPRVGLGENESARLVGCAGTVLFHP